jgi:hypothetical protein
VSSTECKYWDYFRLYWQKTDKWQTRPLVREGAPKWQDSTFQKNKKIKKKISGQKSQIGFDTKTYWLTVSCKVTLTLTYTFSLAFISQWFFSILPPLKRSRFKRPPCSLWQSVRNLACTSYIMAPEPIWTVLYFIIPSHHSCDMLLFSFYFVQFGTGEKMCIRFSMSIIFL